MLQAGNGLDAIALAERHRGDIDLLLTDVVMPETNGRQLAEQILKIRPGLPVLYMTGFTRNAVVHNGMLDPGVNFMAKPFTSRTGSAKAPPPTISGATATGGLPCRNFSSVITGRNSRTGSRCGIRKAWRRARHGSSIARHSAPWLRSAGKGHWNFCCLV